MANETLNPDVTVTISTATPVITEGLGIPLVLVKKQGADATFKPTFGTYDTANDVAAAFGADKTITKIAQLIFGQQNRPAHIDIVEYTDVTSGLAAYQDEDWTFALLADVTDTNEVQNFVMAVSEVANKFGAIQVADPTSLAAFKGLNNIIGFVHPLDLGRLDAAAIGNIANLQPGAYTWKFKQVSGIANNGFSSSQLTAVSNAKGIALKPLSGNMVLSEGWTVGGKYIDEIHARIWIEQQIVAALGSVLINSNKLPYDTIGIAKIKSALSLVFDNAFNLGIIAADDKTGDAAYTVVTTPRSQQSVSDIDSRVYKGASFEYVQSGAIHSINVSGQIVDSL